MIEVACIYYPGIYQYLIYGKEFRDVFEDKEATLKLV